MLQLRAGSQMDARVMAVLNCLATDMEVFADETGKAPAPPEEQDAASKGLLPTAKHMLGLRCWALLHTPDLTDLEQDLGLLVADANSSELDAELHARIMQRYTKVGCADVSKPQALCAHGHVMRPYDLTLELGKVPGQLMSWATILQGDSLTTGLSSAAGHQESGGRSTS